MNDASKKSGIMKETAAETLELAAIGMESEFEVCLDGAKVRPEDLFGDPQSFIRPRLMHRTGTSYHLPTGGAIYFDTGVIEIATPVIEIDKGCAARAGRSLWEGIGFMRSELDAWEKRTGHDLRLVGFSTHYNVSFEPTGDARRRQRTVEKLALLLSFILPIPVMLLATNRRSTGVGVRPRNNRIEVTADFTPSPSLMIATGTLITGIAREVMSWPSYELDMLERERIPVIKGYHPVPHSSRQGWTSRVDTYDTNPFTADIDQPMWELTDGRVMSLRGIAGRITRHFWPHIKRISDPFTSRLIGSVMRGRAPSLLDLDDRPAAYDDVGRGCSWDNLFPERELRRSWYERVLIRAISGQRLRLYGQWYTPVGMRGWSQVVFRRESDNTRHMISIDFLVRHLEDWKPAAPR